MSERFRLAEAKINPDGTVEDNGVGRFLIETETESQYIFDTPNGRFRRVPVDDLEALPGDGDWQPLRGHTAIRIDRSMVIFMGGRKTLTTTHIVKVCRIVGWIDDVDYAAVLADDDFTGLTDDRA